MKYLFLIADGMGDRPLDALGGRTVLEAAHTPGMDGLARSGVVGRCRTIPEAMPPGSDVANMSLLGYDPESFHTGRGPIEAAAMGLVLEPDDLVWRMNLVTLSALSPEGRMLDYSAGHIGTDMAAALINSLKSTLDDSTFTIHPGFQYRHLLIHRGGATQPEAGLNISPPHDITDKPIGPDLAEYGKCPRMLALIRSAADVLAARGNWAAATSVWPWGQGRPLLLPSFQELFKLRGAVVSAVDLIKGLGRAASMTVAEVDGATGLLDTNYEGKVEAALSLLEDHDFVYLHVEAPDECGHEGSVEKKVEAVSRFDARIVTPLMARLEGQAAFLVTCDHFTPIAERTHTKDPVPFLLAGPGLRSMDPVEEFSERAAAESHLLIESGTDLLPFVLNVFPPR
jgi:2,3-bisphosphoglycerate-independent phosphoglycerate mutase